MKFSSLLVAFATLSLLLSSCGAGSDSKRAGVENKAPVQEQTETVSEPKASEKAPATVIARVPLSDLESDDFGKAEFVVVDEETRSRFQNDVPGAFDAASDNNPYDEEEAVSLSFRQLTDSSDEDSLNLTGCGGGCGGCGGGCGRRVGLFGFIGGIFHGAGRIVGGILHGAGAVVAGAVRGTAEVVYGVGDLLRHHKPVFHGWGWNFEYRCDEVTYDHGGYRYFEYRKDGKGTPGQHPGQHPGHPGQHPGNPGKGGPGDFPGQNPPPPGPGPGDKGGEPCPYGCPK